MKFTNLKGEIFDINPLKPEEHPNHGGLMLELTPELALSYEQITLLTAVDYTLRVVASEPYYIDKNNVLWLAAYLDDFKVWLLSQDNHSELRLDERLFNNYLSSKEVLDFVVISRVIYSLELVVGVTYGLVVYETDFFGNDLDREGEKYAVGLVPQSATRLKNMKLTESSMSFVQEKGFKQRMTNRHYSRSCGLAILPPGCKLSDVSGNLTLQENSFCFFEVERFYKSLDGWNSVHGIQVYPTSSRKTPTFTKMDIILKVKLYVQVKTSEGLRIAAFKCHLPFEWVSNIIVRKDEEGNVSASAPKLDFSTMPSISGLQMLTIDKFIRATGLFY